MARKDAVRNRAALIEAAANAFRTQGLDASVNAIAADAGVNVATLYRHVPAKDDLVAAVLDGLLEPLASAAEGAPALDAFVRDAVRRQADHRGLIDAFVREGPDLLSGLREPAVARAHAEGTLRPDFGADELLVFLRMLTIVGKVPDPEPYIEAVLRGLRP
jgi:AcrR family transcriptional regulator